MNKEESEGYVKTSINNCLKKMAEQPEEFFDNYKLQEKYNKVIKENNNLKQALNEIREYIAKDIQKCTYCQVPKYQDILQIIDEVLGDNDGMGN